MLVRSAVEDELSFRSREITKLQTPRVAAKKRVVLRDLNRVLGGQRGSSSRDCIDALDASLDFNVSRHRRLDFRSPRSSYPGRQGTTHTQARCWTPMAFLSVERFKHHMRAAPWHLLLVCCPGNNMIRVALKTVRRQGATRARCRCSSQLRSNAGVGLFQRNPSGRSLFGAGRRCSLDQYPNRYRRFARALAGAQTPSGAHHAISGTAH